MSRKTLIELLKIAGYHKDNAKFTELLISNRISMKTAQESFVYGVKMKENGIKCNCIKCKQ
jgi:hypothetical protein